MTPLANETTDFSLLSAEEAMQLLKTRGSGLMDEEVAARRKTYGLNEISDAQTKVWWAVLAKQFRSLLVGVLVLASILSYATGNYADVYVILIVILIDAGIGFVQEWRAEQAVSSLKKMLAPLAKVIRKNEVSHVPSIELVPGDIIVLEEGDHIPADARLTEARNLRTVEASLTGESLPNTKHINSLKVKTLQLDQVNMLWKGTFVVGGSGKGVVTATGMGTAIGQVASSLQLITTEKSHFQKKIDRLATQMGVASVVCAVLFFVIGYYTLQVPITELLMISVAAMVSIIPEGLPSIIAIVLAIGANRMTKKNAIVREITATETLGAVTTIITDKTGTLTENALTAQSIFIAGEMEMSVSGEGWAPIGNIKQRSAVLEIREHAILLQLLKIASLCNNSSIRHNKESDTYELLGDPTEGALLVLARKGGVRLEGLEKIDDLPFDSSVKFRATLVKEHTGKKLFVAGAPEAVLSRCSRTITSKGVLPLATHLEAIDAKITEWATSSLRVIALAYKDESESTSQVRIDAAKDLIFGGLVGMLDPPRVEVKEAMQQCKRAGIRVIMATGDHVTTAVAIARLVGIVDDRADSSLVALTEDQLRDFDDKEFDDAILRANVFARLTPQTKLRIANRLQELGHLIAMTGDGVNDAPALKKADVGIAMGIMGTDVARDSAKVVLADDNFSTIVHAIEEGRIVFKNARQASFYLITTNLAEIITLIVAISIGLPMPLTAIQILWLNLVTDGIGDMAIATERGHGDIMDEKPLKKDERILSRRIMPFLWINVLLMSGLSLSAYSYFIPQGIELARSAVFIVMSFTQLFNMYNMRSLTQSVFRIGFFTNRFVSVTMVTSIIITVSIIQSESINPIFGFRAMEPVSFIVLASMSSLVLVAGEFYKYIRR